MTTSVNSVTENIQTRTLNGNLVLGTGSTFTFPSVDGSPASAVISDSAGTVVNTVGVTGALVAAGAFTFNLRYRLNDVNTFGITTAPGSLTATAVATLVATAAIPVGYRPVTTNQDTVIPVLVAGAATLCTVRMGTSGDITVFKGVSGSFAIGDTIQFPANLIAYGGSA